MRAVRQSLVWVCLLLACEHSAPYAPGGMQPLGPFGTGLPRRLTFNPGDDRTPFVAGSTIVYSRLDPDAQDRERCLAFLPAAGGTLTREACPPPPRSPADTFVDTWLEPAVSPDGRQVAYMWQQGSLIGVLGFAGTYVVVAPAAEPGDTSAFVWPINYQDPNGRVVDAVSALSWADAHTVRFLVGYEFIFKVKGGGLERYTDTTFESYGLAQLDVETGQVTPPQGATADVTAYAPAPDGGLWLVRADAPQQLRHLAPGADSAIIVGDYSAPVLGLAVVATLPVAIVGDTTLEWLVPGDSLPQRLGVSGAEGPVRRVAAVPGTRWFVAEIERGWDPFGAPANLWLYELP
jgi:hypothetical protein